MQEVLQNRCVHEIKGTEPTNLNTAQNRPSKISLIIGEVQLYLSKSGGKEKLAVLVAYIRITKQNQTTNHGLCIRCKDMNEMGEGRERGDVERHSSLAAVSLTVGGCLPTQRALWRSPDALLTLLQVGLGEGRKQSSIFHLSSPYTRAAFLPFI